MQIDTFDCPKCSAPLKIQGYSTTIQCAYCGANVIVPEELRPKQAVGTSTPPVVVDFRGTTGSGARSVVIFAVLAVACLVGILGLIPVVGGMFMISGSQQVIDEMLTPAEFGIQPDGGLGDSGALLPPQSTATESTGWAQRVMSFGGEGIGQGQLSDARHIGVDAEGNIYVGSYSDGRIQVFDAEGIFLHLWTVDPEFPLRAIAVNRDGTVYVVQRGEITLHDGETGAVISTVNYAGGNDFDAIALTSDGGFVAAWYSNRDDIIRLDASGQETLHIQEAISGITGDSELDTRVAVDGLGTIYALGHFNNAVFVYSPDGVYQNRFGGDGDGPGQFRAPGEIMVDGQGRIYVTDIKGVQVFDSDGRYIGLIEVEGAASGLAIQGDFLYVVARNHVEKFALPQ